MTKVVGSMEYAYDQPDSVGFDWEHDVTYNLNDDDDISCDCNLKGEPMKALDIQVGGDHYTSMKLQPLEKTYLQYGYEGVKHSLYTKVDKYLTRDKGTDRVDIEKAIHCLQLQLEFYDRWAALEALEPRNKAQPIEGNK